MGPTLFDTRINKERYITLIIKPVIQQFHNDKLTQGDF
jgi:hypothetical protein